MVESIKPVNKTYGELLLTIIEGPNIGNTYSLIFDDRSLPFNSGRKSTNEIAL